MMAAHAALTDALPRYTIQYLVGRLCVPNHGLAVCAIPEVEPAAKGVEAQGGKAKAHKCTGPEAKASPVGAQCVILDGQDPADFAQPAHDPPVVNCVQDARLFLVVHVTKAGEQKQVKQCNRLQAPDAQEDVVRPEDLLGG